MITDKDGNKKLIPIVESAIPQLQSEHNESHQNSDELVNEASVQQSNQTSEQVATSAMPRKTGSLSIIFRKVRKLLFSL